MPDEFDFFETPAETEDTTQDAVVAQNPALTTEQFQAYEQRLSKAEQTAQRAEALNQALKKALGSETQEQPTDAFWAQFSKDPEGVIAQKAQAMLQQQLHIQDLSNHFQQSYPELSTVKEMVFRDAYAVFEQAAAQGKPMGEKEAIAEAAKSWQGKLDALVQERMQRQQTDAMKTHSLPYTVPQQGQPLPTGIPDFSNMSHKDFAAIRAKYLSSKGISPS